MATRKKLQKFKNKTTPALFEPNPNAYDSLDGGSDWSDDDSHESNHEADNQALLNSTRRVPRKSTSHVTSNITSLSSVLDLQALSKEEVIAEFEKVRKERDQS